MPNVLSIQMLRSSHLHSENVMPHVSERSPHVAARKTRRRTVRHLLGALLAVALITSACGDGATAETTTTVGATTTTGVAEETTTSTAETTTTLGPPDEIVVQTSLGLTGQNTPLWAAIGEGFFADENIEATIQPGEGSGATAVNVGAGAADLAVIASTSVLDAISKGADLAMIGAFMATDPAGLCYIQERNSIETFSDIEGLSVGGSEGGAITLSLDPLMQNAGADPSTVEYVNLRGGALYAALAADQIDASTCGLGAFATVRALAAEQNLTMGLFSFSEHQELDPVGHSVTVGGQLLAENPDLAQRMLNAFAKATIWSMQNPEAAIDHYMEANPEKDRAVELEKWMDTIAALEGPDGFFKYGEAQISDTLQYAKDILGLEAADELAGAFTNDFVDQLAPELINGELP